MSSRLAELVTPLYRGTVAPSVASFLPTYHERSSSKPFQSNASEDAAQREADIQRPSGVDLSLFGLLESVFRAHNGVLTLDQFVAAVVDRYTDGDASKEAVAVSSVKLFRGIDILDEGSISWDAFSFHMITRKLNESNLSLVRSVQADIQVSKVENIGANSGGVSRIRVLPELARVGAMGVNLRALYLFPEGSDENKDAVPLQSPDRCVVNDVCIVEATGQLAVLGADQTVLLYDVSPIVLLRTRVVLSENHFCIIAVGKRLFAGSVTGNITEITEGETIVYGGCHNAEIYSLVYIPLLSSLASASADGRVLLWDLNAGEKSPFYSPTVSLKGHKQAAMFIAFNARNTLLITGGLEKDALVWNPYVEREPVSRLQGHGYALCGIATRQSQIMTADVSGVVKIWDAKSFRNLFTISLGTSASCLCISNSAIFVGSDSGKIFTLTSAAKSSSQALKCAAVAVSEHTQRVFTATQHSVYVYTFDGKLRKRFPLDESSVRNVVTALALTQNGRAYITGHADGSVRLFSAATGECFPLTSGSPNEGEVSNIVATTTKVVVGTSLGLVRVFQVSQGKSSIRVEYTRHTDVIVSLYITPDENLVISAGLDGLLAVFNLKELRQVTAIRPTEEALISLIPIDPNNLRVCDISGTILNYTLEDGNLIETRRYIGCSATVRGYGVVRGCEYVATKDRNLLTIGGGNNLQVELPGVASKILPFCENYLLVHLQEGHVIITDKNFQFLMYLGNALPLPSVPGSMDDLEISRLAKDILASSQTQTLSVEKPFTPITYQPSNLRIPGLTFTKTPPFVDRLANTRRRAEHVYRETRLPVELGEAAHKMALALADAGMDDLHLFDCQPPHKKP